MTEVDLDEIKLVCEGVKALSDGGQIYIHFPVLKLPDGCNPKQTEALLGLSQHNGYPTRLFLAESIPGRGSNWSTHCILGKTWHTWSWNHVPSALRPMEILAEHLRGLQ